MIDRITVRGARQHNLRDIHLAIPRNSFTVVTGLSGSGKSSLAFDTIYAEGQRRYVETLSPYARQFLDQMERPDVDSIDGLSPALSIEQKTTSRSPRSTVGTITEIYDYLRLLYSSIGKPHCPHCGAAIHRQSADQIVARILEEQMGRRVMILAPIVRGRKGEFKKEFERFAQMGFVRARVDGELFELEGEIKLDRRRNHTVEIIIDRLAIRPGLEVRLGNSIKTATKHANGLVLVAEVDGEERLYSEKLACTECGASIPELEPRSFSFNSPYGACPTCNGLGSLWEFDPDKIIVDSSRPALDGAFAQTLMTHPIERGLERAAKSAGIAISKPFDDLPAASQEFLLYGTGRGSAAKDAPKDSAKKFRGVIGLIEEWFEDEDYDGDYDWAARYKSPVRCPACNGARLRPESLAVRLAGLSIAEFAALPVGRSLAAAHALKLSEREHQIAGRIVAEIQRRLGFLTEVGLDYLSLDRSAATLSGGESQRVRLGTQIGTQLRGVLYVLDEPSIGLHARDNDRLLKTLQHLRDLGNTILVVEHDQETIERADHVIDLGPGAGRLGGELVAEGTPSEVAASERSLTGQYLSGRKEVPVPSVRRTPNARRLIVHGATEHNLKNLRVEFPLGMLIVVTGVSGSGKSTLVNDILYASLAQKIYRSRMQSGKHTRLEGMEHLDKVIRIDQSAIGRTPRSNPATYTGVFTHIRQLFADAARGARPRLQAGPFQLQRQGRPLRSLPGRRTAAHRDEFPARRVRHLRHLPRTPLQPRNPAGEVQGLFDRRPAGSDGGGGSTGDGEPAADPAEAANAGRCGAGLHPPGAVVDDAVGRRGAAHQAGA